MSISGDNQDDNDALEFVCNIDDMTSEELSFACKQLFKSGALDVFTSPIFMKKGRQAFLLTVLCKRCDRESVLHSLFENTTTIGVREHICKKICSFKRNSVGCHSIRRG
ncbi:MAG: LarC family nickel insertion protein [Clostridiales bacterium]|nr:LarC family nickel insertion protein [Clostridiales bacterium]